MKILVVSQVYYPDNVSVSQHLTDLCTALSKRGHYVSVLTSRYPYEEKNTKYQKKEVVNNVNIRRIWSFGFGKGNAVFRFLDFISFNLSAFIHLFRIPQKSYDLIIGLTAPPLLSYFASVVAKIKSIRFCYWVMDMQPELAIKSGFIKENSLLSRILIKLGNSILNNSFKIIVLDRFMKDYLIEKHQITNSKIEIVPVWPVIEKCYTGDRLENPFRRDHHFGDKIVIMYSGNHSYVHPLDTLLNIARELKNDNMFLFVFIGGGVRKKDITEFKRQYNLENIIQLPYQPREKIQLSLGSSDIQVVILGDNLVGFTHPNKIYGALFIGKPIIYIGPENSHVTEILSGLQGNISVKHGESKELINKLVNLSEDFSKLEKIGKSNQKMAIQNFAPEILINKMCCIIEDVKN